MNLTQHEPGNPRLILLPRKSGCIVVSMQKLPPNHIPLFYVNLFHYLDCFSINFHTYSFIAFKGKSYKHTQKEAFINLILLSCKSHSSSFINNKFLSKNQGPSYLTHSLSLQSSNSTRVNFGPKSLKRIFLSGLHIFHNVCSASLLMFAPLPYFSVNLLEV